MDHKRVRNHQHLFGSLTNGQSAESGVVETIDPGTNERFQFWGANITGSVQTGLLFEVLIGGVVKFLQNLQSGSTLAIARVGPPDGTFLNLEGTGEVRLRMTNNTGSTSANCHANAYFTVQPRGGSA